MSITSESLEEGRQQTNRRDLALKSALFISFSPGQATCGQKKRVSARTCALLLHRQLLKKKKKKKKNLKWNRRPVCYFGPAFAIEQDDELL